MNKKTTKKNNENYQGIFDIKLAKYVKSGSERDIYISADFPNQVLKVPHTRLSGKTLKKPVKKFFKNILFKYYPKASHSFVRREIKESEK